MKAYPLVIEFHCPDCGCLVVWTCFDETGWASCPMDGRNRIQWKVNENFQPCRWKGIPVFRGPDGNVYVKVE